MSDKKKVELKLNHAPDEFGFIYGQVICGDDFHHVNILPPKDHWQGGQVLDGFAPHDTDWVVLVDGEEIGRVTKQEQVAQLCETRLLP